MSMSNLGLALLSQGKFAEAEPHIEAALARYRALFGPHHPTVATILSNLGQAHVRAGRVDRGLALLREALALKEAPSAASTSRCSRRSTTSEAPTASSDGGPRPGQLPPRPRDRRSASSGRTAPGSRPSATTWPSRRGSSARTTRSSATPPARSRCSGSYTALRTRSPPRRSSFWPADSSASAAPRRRSPRSRRRSPPRIAGPSTPPSAAACCSPPPGSFTRPAWRTNACSRSPRRRSDSSARRQGPAATRAASSRRSSPPERGLADGAHGPASWSVRHGARGDVSARKSSERSRS
jgi:hypothetical protein